MRTLLVCVASAFWSCTEEGRRACVEEKPQDRDTQGFVASRLRCLKRLVVFTSGLKFLGFWGSRFRFQKKIQFNLVKSDGGPVSLFGEDADTYPYLLEGRGPCRIFSLCKSAEPHLYALKDVYPLLSSRQEQGSGSCRLIGSLGDGRSEQNH